MIAYTADVFCDRCGDWTHGVTSNERKRQATEARDVAKLHGWSHSRKSEFPDLCPECLAIVRRGE